jgi:hypothetical protein
MWSTFFDWIEAVQSLAQEHQLILWLLAASSAVLIALSLALVPIVVRYLPPDYFIEGQHRPHNPPHTIVQACRQCLGIVLLVLGLIMLVLPGQGLLTILASLFILDFPGKVRFLRAAIKKFSILPTLNAIRKRHGLPPFEWKE